MVKFNRFVLSLLASTMVFTASGAEEFGIVQQTLDNPDNEPAPVHPVPHPRQMKWQETEFYAFFHFGMNTFTGLEWGYGSESPNRFAPTAVPNPRQWLEAVKAAGMRSGERRVGKECGS